MSNYKNSNSARNGKFSDDKQQSKYSGSKSKRRRKPSQSEGDTTPRDNGSEKYIGMACGKGNDPRWYGENAQLVADAASMSFAWPVGNKFDFGITDDAQMEHELNSESVPGVMAIWTAPTVGISGDATSPVSTAAFNIYSYVRHANSGHPNYDAPDLMLYLLAMDSAYSYYTFLVRVYGLMNAYTQYNRYYPRALIEGMCLDFDNLQLNLANLRYFLNSYAVKLGSMCVPSSMSYFTRHQWIYSNIFTDSQSVKAQSYMFCPDGFHQYDEYNGAGRLVYRRFYNRSTPHTLQTLVGYANMLINPLIGSEDLGIMSGDVLKAFKPEGVFKIAQIPDNYLVLPTFDAAVLVQIQNATILKEVLQTPDSLNITQDVDSGAVLQGFSMNIPADHTSVRSIYAGKRMLSVPIDSPTPDLLMEATRLTVGTRKQTGLDAVRIEHCGSEVALRLEICKFVEISGVWKSMWTESVSYANELDAVSHDQWMHAVQNIAQFNYHPMVFLTWTSDTPAAKNAIYLFDVDNYNLVSDFELAKMHETALLSEFTVPQMGAFSRKT